MLTDFLLIFLAVWLIIMFLGEELKKRSRKLDVMPFLLIYKIRENANLKLQIPGKKFLSKAIAFFVPASFIITFYIVYLLTINVFNYLYKGENIPAVIPVPGFTLPLLYGYLAIVIFFFTHEFMHAVACSLENIRVKSFGLAIFLLFASAFVEPDPVEFEEAKSSTKMKILASGTLGNILAAALVFLVALSIFSGYPMNPSGVVIIGVEGKTPASKVLQPNTVITQVNNTKISNYLEFRDYMLKTKPHQLLKIKTNRGEYVVNLTKHPKIKEIGYIGVLIDPFPYFKPRVPLSPFHALEASKAIFWVETINLAGLLNLLPIPFLDGGKLFKILFSEAKKKSKHNFQRKIINIAEAAWTSYSIGIFAVLMLAAFANFLNIIS